MKPCEQTVILRQLKRVGTLRQQRPTLTETERTRFDMADISVILHDDAIQSRYWAKVDRRGPTDCWLWQASRSAKGYGMFGVGGKVRTVTHVALTLAGKPRPPAPADCALHSCDTPSCVNPAHLRWGTALDNAQDRDSRNRRTACGPASHRAHAVKLNEEQVKMILTSPALGKDIADQLGVHKATVSDIRCGKTWRHLTGSAA